MTRFGALASRLGWVAVAALGLAGCDSNLGFPDPVTRQGQHNITLWRVFLPIALAVVLLIWGLVGWSVVRYRRRSDDVPPQRQTMVKLEIFYTVVPLAIVAVLFTLTVQAQRDLNRLTPNPAVRVEVKGFQWQWRFRYPTQHVTVTGTPDHPAELVLPVGETVRFHLVATDVIHSFWVPRFLEKRDLIPGVDNKIEVYVKQPGTWVGRCAEYCGLSHWQMSFSVRAVAPAEFDRWTRTAAALPQPVVGSTRDPQEPATTATTKP